MADNISTTPGSGASIAADDVGGVLHQRVKISVGADGSATDLVGASDGIAYTGVIGVAPYVMDGSNLAQRQRGGYTDNLAGGYTGAVTPMLYNGSGHDRQRNNLEGTLLASAARTTTTGSATQTNYNHRGVILALEVTVAGTGNLTIAINHGSPDYGLAAGTTHTGTGGKFLLAYPGVLDVDYAYDGRSVALPRSWRAYILHSDGSSWTYSLSYSLIL